MQRAAARIGPALASAISPERRALAAQFLRFGVVGLAGFVVDTGTVYALRGAIGLYAAGMAAWFVAATVTWALNRSWTFRAARRTAPHRQWALFLAANALGFVLNRGAYAALIAASPLCRAYPVLAVAAGAVSGMMSNFTLSRRLVFR